MKDQNQTTITDIDIPFGRLVVIMVKLMLAAIPAIIGFYAILGLIAYLSVVAFGFGSPNLKKIDFLPGGGTQQHGDR
jgi:hypothetical protein